MMMKNTRTMPREKYIWDNLDKKRRARILDQADVYDPEYQAKDYDVKWDELKKRDQTKLKWVM